MSSGYAYFRCLDSDCGTRQYDRPSGADYMHRVADAHTKATGHTTIAGQHAESDRPEACPECAEVVCDADCALAALMGWPTEASV